MSTHHVIPLRDVELHAYLALAREAITAHLERRRPRAPEGLLPLPAQGVFVTLHTRRGHALRGCIGHMAPMKKNLADEVVSCAISAATQDPRFIPVERDELDNLEIELSLLEPEFPVDDVSMLDPRVYGVVVRTATRAGVLLPDIEGVDTVEQQIGIALRKAGIAPYENYRLHAFRVLKVREGQVHDVLAPCA